MNELIEDKIISIEEIESPEKVYLMEIENNHNYFVENILSKNCQQLSKGDIKTIITRAGENTKVILAGDISQIDSPNIDMYSCGLVHVVEAFKNEEMFGYVHFTKSERSELAEKASKLL